MQLPETITIKHPQTGETCAVSTAEYCKAKSGDLTAFGLACTPLWVELQLEKLLAGEPLDVIGKFLERDIVR